MSNAASTDQRPQPLPDRKHRVRPEKNDSRIDETLKKIDGLGGSTVDERTPVGDMGFAAYFKDTEGNLMGLWENAPG